MNIVITQTFKKTLKKFSKEKKKILSHLETFRKNPNYPSLRIEKLNPKGMGLFSIRINRQIRVIFSWKKDTVIMHSVSKHYE